MATPILVGKEEHNAPDNVSFSGRVVFGSSAVASYVSQYVTVERTTTGTIRIQLPKRYKYLTGFSAGWLQASGAVLDAVIASSTVDSDGRVLLELRSGSTPTDPSSGDTLFFEVKVSSSVLASR